MSWITSVHWKTLYMIFLVKHICMKNSGFSIIKSVTNLKISWSFLLEKLSTRTLDCDKIGSNWRGDFSLSVELSSFIFLLLYHELLRNVINSTFCGLCAAISKDMCIDFILSLLEYSTPALIASHFFHILKQFQIQV